MASALCRKSVATNPRRKKFDTCPVGLFHIDLAEGRTAQGKLCLFAAIDRTSKFAVVEPVERADMRAAAAFLKALVQAVPYRIHTVLTDNGMRVRRSAEESAWANSAVPRPSLRQAMSASRDRPPAEQAQPSAVILGTNSQVERMNRTIEDAAVKGYFYDTRQQLKAHLTDFLQACNFARRLKTLKGLAPCEYLCKLRT